MVGYAFRAKTKQEDSGERGQGKLSDCKFKPPPNRRLCATPADVMIPCCPESIMNNMRPVISTIHPSYIAQRLAKNGVVKMKRIRIQKSMSVKFT